jgi:hypothetical protein
MDPIKSSTENPLATLLTGVAATRRRTPLITDKFKLEDKPLDGRLEHDAFTRSADVDPLERIIERLRAAAATQPVTAPGAAEEVDTDAITAATETRVSALAAEYIAPYWAQASIGWAAPVSAAAAAAEATEAATVVPAHTATTTTATTTPATSTTPAVTTTTSTATTTPATLTPSASAPAATTTTSTSSTAPPTTPTPATTTSPAPSTTSTATAATPTSATTSTEPSRQGSAAAWLHGLFGR